MTAVNRRLTSQPAGRLGSATTDDDLEEEDEDLDEDLTLRLDARDASELDGGSLSEGSLNDRDSLVRVKREYLQRKTSQTLEDAFLEQLPIVRPGSAETHHVS